MAKIEDISWGSYQEFEGPFYRGSVRFEIPKNPAIIDKYLAVITSVESGHYDAINMYDRMILTAGIIQWGEANTFGVSRMLGYMSESGLEQVIHQHLKPALEASGASFKINPKGNWRFFIGNLEVNSVALQQRLFLGCDGRKGSWLESSKRHAKLWAACIASVFEDPKTIEIQKKYTAERLTGFVMADARKALFDDKTSTTWADATRAIYLTYAINLPRIAGEMYSSTKFVGKKWSPEWCICLIKRLTFGPNIKIYPKRYEALRPCVERLFGIELPKYASDLNAWEPPLESIIGPNKEGVKSIDQGLLNELNDIISNKPKEKATKPLVATTVTNFFNKVISLFK